MRTTSKLLLCVALSALACSSGGGSGGGGDSTGGGNATFPLDVADDGQHLEGDNGESFLMTGDAAWSLMVALDENETEAYLEDRRLRGFNTILVNLIERGAGGPANANGDAPFTTPNDFTTPNEAYFSHVDRVLDIAASKGMLVLLAPAYLGEDCGDDGWCQQMLAQTVSAMASYGRFLGDRYRDRTNILWVHGGDARASDHGAGSRVNAIANAIVDTAPAHLHTAHCSRDDAAIDCYDQPWLDVNTIHSQCDDLPGAAREAHAHRPREVFFQIEGRYENDGANMDCLIGQYAVSVLAGGAGHVFGNTPLWFFGSGWEDELDSPGSVAIAHLDDLFRSRAWWKLEPDRHVLVNGGNDQTAAAMTRDNETIMIYTDSPRTLRVDVSDLNNLHAHAIFFDPTDGSSIDLGTTLAIFEEDYEVPGRGVLVIDAVL
jgi:hypothetical protein